MSPKRKRPEAAPGRRTSGNWNPDWESFATLDPAWTERVVSLAMAPAASGVLEAKTIEFIAIALGAASTRPSATTLRRHIRRALELGATKEEILAVLQCASLQGLESLSVAVPILVEQLDARKHARRPEPVKPRKAKEAP